MANPRGNPNLPKGRQKGAVNKATASVKGAIEKCFDDLGGVPALVEWASDPKNASIFYGQIWPKILPKNIELTGKDGGPVITRVELVPLDNGAD